MVAFAWCCGVLLCAVLFLLAFRRVVALLCGVVRLGALVWFAVLFCTSLVLWCLAVWCAAVLCRLWLPRFYWCLAVSCCAVQCGARLGACVVARCSAFFVAVCCPGALCGLVCPCAVLRCSGFGFLSSPAPPPPVAAPLVWLCPASCRVLPCPAVRVVLCCAALVLSFLLFFFVCAVAVAWCCGAFIVRCAVALGVLWCGGVALLCGVLCFLVPWCPVLCPVVLCSLAPLCCPGLLCFFFSVSGLVPSFALRPLLLFSSIALLLEK